MHTSNTDHDETLKEQIELILSEYKIGFQVPPEMDINKHLDGFTQSIMQLIKEDREKFTERAVELINKNLFSAEDERENIRETLTQLSNPAHEAQRQDFNTEG
jgi:hypothetical protein